MLRAAPTTELPGNDILQLDCHFIWAIMTTVVDDLNYRGLPQLKRGDFTFVFHGVIPFRHFRLCSMWWPRYWTIALHLNFHCRRLQVRTCWGILSHSFWHIFQSPSIVVGRLDAITRLSNSNPQKSMGDASGNLTGTQLNGMTWIPISTFWQ